MTQFRLPVLQFTQTMGGQPIDLYVGTVTAGDLTHRTRVPRYNDLMDEGYQRPPYPSRVKKIARYVLRGRIGLMPTAILVNIRDGYSISPGSNGFYELAIEDDVKGNTMDGQHRWMGLEEALREEPSLTYQLPVVFTLGLNEAQEMDLFDVVNNEAKSIDVGLTREIKRRRLEEGRSQGVEPTEAALRQNVATNLVRALAREEGVWKDRIQLADEWKTPKPIRSAAFANSLDPVLRSDWAARFVEAQDIEILRQRIDNYWQAINRLMPEAFAQADQYNVVSPTGVYTFNQVLREFGRRADKAGDWSSDFFMTELKRLEEWVTLALWHIKTGHELTQIKGSQAAKTIVRNYLSPILLDI